MDIGFLGLGNMGAGMAANLLRAGHTLTAYNRSFDKVEALADLGALPARTVADACRGDVVVSMLANDDAVEAMTFGADGVLANLPDGAVHVSCSTISVALAERLSAAHAEAGQRFVAAPVFGRPEAAAAATLFVVAAGDPATVAPRAANSAQRSGDRSNTVSLCSRVRRRANAPPMTPRPIRRFPLARLSISARG